MSDQPPKKKRGRRPKNKIISNINPVFDSNGLDAKILSRSSGANQRKGRCCLSCEVISTLM